MNPFFPDSTLTLFKLLNALACFPRRAQPPLMAQPRVTLSRIAAKTGLHISTVSLALRNSPKLPEATRAKVQRAAKILGYKPDPILSALVAYRTTSRPITFQAKIAWFNGYADRKAVRSIKTLNEYWEGANERADELGYKLEEFWLHEPGLTPSGLRRRLLARGIRGILVFPMGTPVALTEFAWRDFSAVALGYSLTEPQLHRVTNHQFRTALMLFRELRRLGYLRIGLSLVEVHDRRVNLALSSAFGAYDMRTPPADRVPPHLRLHWEDREDFLKWLRRERPDAIITHDERIYDWVRAEGLKVPGDIGLAFFNINRTEKTLTGVHQCDHRIGRVALNRLENMLHVHESGVPDFAQHVLIDGEWLQRKTTRQVGPPAEWFLDLPSEEDAMRQPLTTPPAGKTI